jgi:Raf kinase inhibitor-like YbhB/YbcL family protein
MSRWLAAVVVIAIIAIGAFVGLRPRNNNGGIIDLSPKNKGANMQITSSAFNDNESIPAVYTCKGQGINPPLAIAGVPAQAKSLVLIMHDPDAPSGDYSHWLVWNISPQTTTITENSAPAGAVEGPNGSGNNKYAGPCPPSGTHHYKFDLYALDDMVNLPAASSRQDVDSAMSSHVLAHSTLTGLFGQ